MSHSLSYRVLHYTDVIWAHHAWIVVAISSVQQREQHKWRRHEPETKAQAALSLFTVLPAEENTCSEREVVPEAALPSYESILSVMIFLQASGKGPAEAQGVKNVGSRTRLFTFRRRRRTRLRCLKPAGESNTSAFSKKQKTKVDKQLYLCHLSCRAQNTPTCCFSEALVSWLSARDASARSRFSPNNITRLA